MITAERVLEVSGRKDKNEGFKGTNINLSITDVKVDGETIEMGYEYTVNYEEKMGMLRIKGVITAKEDKKLAESVRSEWMKSQKLPDDYAGVILSFINFSGAVNGTPIAKELGLPAPFVQFMPQRIQLPKGK